MKILRVIVVAGAVGGLGSPLRAELANAIQAIVHDTVITRQEVERFTEQVNGELVRSYRARPVLYEQKLAQVWKENLETLVERQLILHEFVTAGYNLPESIIEEYVQESIKKDFRDRVTFTRTLQAEGLTSEKYRQRIREAFIREQMQYKNVSGAVIISPHKIESYYLAHKEEYKVEEEVKLRMIVLNKPASADAAEVRKLAEEIRTKIKDGTSFAEMASVYSQGRQGKEGGDWGWVQKFDRDGAPVLRKELSDVAFALKPGELSDIIELPEVTYLMLVEDKRPAHLKALGEVRDEIEKALLREERDRLQKQWIERLRKKTFIRYF